MITNTTYRVLVEKIGGSDPSEFIGNEGELFYDPSDLVLRLSDGTTTGGVEVTSGGGGGGSGAQGVQGVQGESVQGTSGTSINIAGSIALTGGNEQTELNDSGNAWYPPTVGDSVINTVNGNLWVYDGSQWDDAGSLLGPQGAQGLGSQGTQGDQGIQGTEGFQGVQGTTGESIQGTEGSQGVQGVQGESIQGTEGSQGLWGDQGVQGVQGEAIQGTEGAQGLWGDQGLQGVQGDQGVQGIIGESIQGTEGSQGVQGVQGDLGVQGVQGEAIQGTEGSQGAQGVQGVQGDQGVQGEAIQGIEGSQGVQGVQGESIQGTEGSQGIVGESIQGIEGSQGVQGVQGESIQGIEGFQGAQGIQGESIQGTQGEPGAPGGGGGESYWELNNAGIHTTSNVGIGTTDPTSPLTVVGDAKISDIKISGTQIIGDGTNSNLGDLELIPNDTLIGSGQYVKLRPTTNLDQTHIHIEAGNVNNADLYLGDDDRFVKIDHTGPVVIGVPESPTTSNWTAPSDAGPITFIMIDTIEYPWAQYLIIGDTITLPDTTVVNIVNNYLSGNTMNVYLESNISYLTNDVLVFSYTPRTEWKFNSDSSAVFPGSLGIGSTQPSVALDVNGHIKAVGFVTAAAFIGDGSNLRSVDGTHVVTYSSASNISNSSETISGISTYVPVGILTGSLASDNGDGFGYSIAMTYDGSTLIVGAFGDELSDGGNYGMAYVFDRTGDSFRQVGILTGTYANNTNDSFGSNLAVSADGKIIAISAPSDGFPGGDPNTGIIYIYDREYGNIKLSGIVTAGQYAISNSSYGNSLSLSEDGNTLVVGASNQNIGLYTGQVYVYDRIGNDWNLVGILTGTDTQSYGYSVATSSNGRVIAVGDYYNSVGVGSVYIYDRILNQINLVGIITGVYSSEDGDSFGYSVDVSSDGKTIVVGAPYDETDQSSVDSGLIYVYDRLGEQFNLVGIITGAVDEYLGNSISISADGNTIISGISGDNVCIINRQGDRFSSFLKLSGQYTDGTDGFGFNAVSISGDGKTIAAGSPFDELSEDTGYGLVYVYNQERDTYLYSTSEGNIGINSSTPTEKLDVDGNVKVSGSVSALGGFISMGSTTPITIELFGNELVFTAAGIGSTSFTLSLPE